MFILQVMMSMALTSSPHHPWFLDLLGMVGWLFSPTAFKVMMHRKPCSVTGIRNSGHLKVNTRLLYHHL